MSGTPRTSCPAGVGEIRTPCPAPATVTGGPLATAVAACGRTLPRAYTRRAACTRCPLGSAPPAGTTRTVRNPAATSASTTRRTCRSDIPVCRASRPCVGQPSSCAAMCTSIASSTNRSAVLRPHRASSFRRARSADQFLSARLGRRHARRSSESTSDSTSHLPSLHRRLHSRVRRPELPSRIIERRTRRLELALKLKSERSRVRQLLTQLSNLGRVHRGDHFRPLPARRAATEGVASASFASRLRIDAARSVAIRRASGSPSATARRRSRAATRKPSKTVTSQSRPTKRASFSAVL